MDQSFSELYGSDKGLELGGEYRLDSSYQSDDGIRFGTNGKFVDQNYFYLPLLPPDPIHGDLSLNQEGEVPEDFDFSDVVLKYISQMLMEEDMEDKTCMFQESAALQAQEQSLYELIGKKYPSPPDDPTIPCADQKLESPDSSHTLQDSSYSISTSTSTITTLADPGSGWNSDSGDYKSPPVASQSTSQSSYGSSYGASNVVEGFVDSPMSTPRVHETFNEIESVMQFKRGFEEASKFIPNADSLIVDLESYKFLSKELKDSKDNIVTVEKKYESEYLPDGSRGKKNPHSEDPTLEEGRSNKQSAFCSESTVTSDMFDMVLLNCGKNDSSLREALQNGASKNSQQNDQSKSMNGGKTRGKKQGKRDVVDLRTLLTLCAQSVAADDRRSAEEFLKQIRQHSSPTGDGMQRMAHYFADGLEARMAGSGTRIYKALITKPTSAADVLKAYHLFLAACPFKKLSNFFSNKTIMNVAEKVTRLHIIDFGILYGFQWPCLIQRLSSRPEGPPKLRITGIDFPQPGFRPAERVEETGRRLTNYAETFKVPFQFNAIAQKWDTIQIEDLKLDQDEVLVVNCMYRLRNLLDETVVVDSPRDKVLNLIRKMNPDVFILGTVNGAYSAPFFITRFREALFHFSTLFDMLETNVPREILERMLIEREIFGREAMNVIACEGSERIEKPETYKLWQVRNLRAGFRQLPLNQEIMQMAKDRVKTCYHKDFVIDKDGQWMLQGWKGRTVYALSSWSPA